MTQSPRIATSASGNRPTKQDYGLESISEELPIVEPEDTPIFMDSQFRFMAPKPAPMRPDIPQAQAKKKSAVKYPIPQAFKAPEPPKKTVDKKEPQIKKAVKAPAGPVKPNLHKRTHWMNDTRSALRQANVTDTLLKSFVLKMMQGVMYHTQDGNMKQVEEMAVKYGKVKQYRMAFIVLQMDEIKKEMYLMYFFMAYHYNLGAGSEQKNVTVNTYLYYYSHAVQKNIDVTYSVEYLIEHFSEL